MTSRCADALGVTNNRNLRTEAARAQIIGLLAQAAVVDPGAWRLHDAPLSDRGRAPHLVAADYRAARGQGLNGPQRPQAQHATRRDFESSVTMLLGAVDLVAVACIAHDDRVTGSRRWARLEEAVREHVRPSDRSVRWDDQTIVIAFPDCAVGQAVSVVERVREALALMLLEEREAPYTVSAGLADSTQGRQLSTLIVHSDEALEAARRAGGNRAVVGGWEAEPYARVPHRLSIRTEVAG